MTKPTSTSNEEIVEIDAMDVQEWEKGQLTPLQSDAKLAALVKQSVEAPAPASPPQASGPRKTATMARVQVAGTVPRAGLQTPAVPTATVKPPATSASSAAPTGPVPVARTFGETPPHATPALRRAETERPESPTRPGTTTMPGGTPTTPATDANPTTPPATRSTSVGAKPATVNRSTPVAGTSTAIDGDADCNTPAARA